MHNIEIYEFFCFQPNYTQVAETCNTWRVYGDIYDAWQSIMSIVNYYGYNPGDFIGAAGPGKWNDADMVTDALILQNLSLLMKKKKAGFPLFFFNFIFKVFLRTFQEHICPF